MVCSLVFFIEGFINFGVFIDYVYFLVLIFELVVVGYIVVNIGDVL